MGRPGAVTTNVIPGPFEVWELEPSWRRSLPLPHWASVVVIEMKGQGVDADEQPADAVSVNISAATEGQLCGLADNIAASSSLQEGPLCLISFSSRAPRLPARLLPSPFRSAASYRP
jgi:hypothetical protein